MTVPGNDTTNAPEFSVSELASAIKQALEDGFGYVRLRGEISGFRGQHSSGHCYFALKDDKARIEAVIWRGVFQKLKFKPEEGMEVVTQGRISTFPGSSKYQIVIETLEPAGAGALMALLDERKRRLSGEGLFAAERKRPLPFLPRVVGIVTSPTGAVIRDMLHGFMERFPVGVLVWPVRVQGETSGAEVAAGIRGFNALHPASRIPRPDVLIVARGGGSLEDLWGFNEEIVVRAAAESDIPLISAVGHETDWTLIDLASDARAPTPTKAAEWAVPKYSDLIEQTIGFGSRLAVSMPRLIDSQRTKLKATARGLPRREDLLALPRQRFDSIERRLGRALLSNTRVHAMRHARVSTRFLPQVLETRLELIRGRLDMLAGRGSEALARIASSRRTRFERLGGRHRSDAVFERLTRSGERLDALLARVRRALSVRVGDRRRVLSGHSTHLASLSYQSVLRRGYALVRDNEGRMVRHAASVQAGVVMKIEFSDGLVTAQALETAATGVAGPGSATPTQDSERAARATKRPVRKSTRTTQGTLF